MASPSAEDIAAGVPAQVNVVARIPAPGGGTYVFGSDGGVFAIGGSKYAGSVPGLQGDTLAGQHQFAGNGFTVDPNGGYEETDTLGRHYAFGGAPYTGPAATPPPNPLGQDPAYLAFLRSSGLGVDQAVRDYENSVGMNQRAARTAMSELTDPFGQRSVGREQDLQGYVNRGYSGSGQAAKSLTGYDTETANQQNKINTDLADQTTAAGQTFGKTVGDLSTKGVEQGINTGQDQGWNKFLQDEAAKYPDMADKIMGSGSGGSNG